jgi:hypothetical protein
MLSYIFVVIPSNREHDEKQIAENSLALSHLKTYSSNVTSTLLNLSKTNSEARILFGKSGGIKGNCHYITKKSHHMQKRRNG